MVGTKKDIERLMRENPPENPLKWPPEEREVLKKFANAGYPTAQAYKLLCVESKLIDRTENAFGIQYRRVRKQYES